MTERVSFPRKLVPAEAGTCPRENGDGNLWMPLQELDEIPRSSRGMTNEEMSFPRKRESPSYCHSQLDWESITLSLQN